MYYSSFDWLSPEQLEQVLPEDGDSWEWRAMRRLEDASEGELSLT